VGQAGEGEPEGQCGGDRTGERQGQTGRPHGLDWNHHAEHVLARIGRTTTLPTTATTVRRSSRATPTVWRRRRSTPLTSTVHPRQAAPLCCRASALAGLVLQLVTPGC
jgi:hypothetical protein